MRHEPKVDQICLRCAKPFKSHFRVCKFCSPSCKATDRWASGKDDEERTCVTCGKVFTANRYKTTRSCSRTCGAAAGVITMAKRKAAEADG